MTPLLSLFEEENARGTFPSTRYQGSKYKIINWILDNLKDVDFDSCLDLFGGTGVFSYHAKQIGKTVHYNDKLKFNYIIGKALIENDSVLLNKRDVDFILENQPISYSRTIYDNFEDIYYTAEENDWLDRIIHNINSLQDDFKKSAAFFCLFQACIVKGPYNLFHRANLYMRFAEVERTFGNKKSWDRSFESWFKQFVEEYNNAVFYNGKKHTSHNYDAKYLDLKVDLVYIDPPYMNSKGLGTDYLGFYHFLEGISRYEEWNNLINHKSKNKSIKSPNDPWRNKIQIATEIDLLIQKHSESTIVLSYRSDGIPSEEEIIEIVSKYKNKVKCIHYGAYKYALSKNNDSKRAVNYRRIKVKKDEFRDLLEKELQNFSNYLSTPDGQWTVKGFVDIYRNVYTISKDTKVISKLIELMLFPLMAHFANKNNLQIVLGEHQNHYPDMTFVSESEELFAVDLKSTYRLSDTEVNGFTLGAFTGYFRERNSTKNVTYPYSAYSGHFVLGVIYNRIEAVQNEMVKYSVDDLEKIVSVAGNFQFLLQEKWKIATDKPGSGNTKNIGSVKSIHSLINGLGSFSELGEQVFDDYWINFMTSDMARKAEVRIPYCNLTQYKAYIVSKAELAKKINDSLIDAPIIN